MPSYDPQRSRSRRRVADDEGPAPVDALLGPPPATDPTPEPAPPAAADAPPEPDAVPAPAAASPPPEGDQEPAEHRPAEPLIVDLDQPAPVTVPRDRGRLVLFALALVSIVVQVALFLWWRRRRAQRPV